MARLDISQTAEARRLGALAEAAHAEYTVEAAKTAVAWKKAGRPRPGGYFDAKSKDYADYQNALEDKQEAYVKWMRAASAHGHYMMPKTRDEE